jgi:transmembrane sensor
MPQINQEIDATAAGWAARLDRGPLSTEDERSLEAWLEQDARHQGAFMRMRAIAMHTERARALGPNFEPDRFAVPSAHRFSRRRTLWVAGLAAAACVAGIVALPLIAPGQAYKTQRGEVRVISLKDGSVVTLNTASRAEVDFNDATRKVRLIEGEALFEVAKDSLRPFIVDAGDASVRALGTSFSVRRLGDAPIHVTVSEGLVEVKQSSVAAPVRIAANMRAVIAMPRAKIGPAPIAISPEAVSRELAWREGRIAFEAESLAAAAATFARYSPTRIVIDDPIVARKEITGLFTANDPVSFARAAAASLGLTAEIAEGEVRLGR